MATSKPIQKRIDPKKTAAAAEAGAKAANQKPANGQKAAGGQKATGQKAAVKPAAGSKSGRPGGRPPKAGPVRKATVGDWIGGARIRTLPLAVAPVALGSAAAFLVSAPGWHWVRILLCLAVALAIQIGVNYANDYSDGVRGTDNYRVGPSRLTGSGAAKPRTVLTVALVFFALAAVAGVLLVIFSGYYWMLAVGAVCIVAAYFYTGGKRPYGYYGLGELFVFVFFGLVATVGTTFVQVGTVNIESWLSAVSSGLLACAVLMVNNLRDLEQDKLAKKHTLAVIVGSRWARALFGIFALLPFVILAFFVIFYDGAWLIYFALLAILPAVVITATAKTAPEFMIALRLTSLTALAFGLGLGAVVAFGS